MAADGDVRKVNDEWQSYLGGTWYPSDRGLIQVLDAVGVHNVTGSGNAMRFHYTSGAGGIETTGVFNMQQMQNAVERHNEALSKPAPSGEFADLWEQNMGGLPLPEFENLDPDTGRPQPGTVDPSKVLDAVRAYEAVNGPLPGGGAGEIVNLGEGYDQDIIIGADGKVTKIDKATGAKTSYDPGLSTVGDDLKGYDVLQQRSGQLDPIKQRVDPSYIIDPQTMQPYFQQPDGSLQAAPIPSIDDQISMHLVDGNMDAAVGKANFRDRPTSLEYFNAAMEWARTPADIFTISALVRGIFEPTPGPMGEMRRVGAPPAWAAQAWVGLQNSMGIPVESMTETPGAAPGSASPMTVASSSGLVNFQSATPSATTFDGKTINPSPTATPTPTPTTTPTPTPTTTPTTAPTAAASGMLRLWDTNTGTYEYFNPNDLNQTGRYNDLLEAGGYLAEGDQGFGTQLTEKGQFTSQMRGDDIQKPDPIPTGVGDQGKWFYDTLNGTWSQFAGTGTFNLSGTRYLPEGHQDAPLRSTTAPPTLTSMESQLDGAGTNITTIYGPDGSSMEIDLNNTNLLDWHSKGWSLDPNDVGKISALDTDEAFVDAVDGQDYRDPFGDDALIELDVDRSERLRQEERLRQVVAERDALFGTPSWATGSAGGDDEFIPEGAIGSPVPAPVPSWLTGDYDYTGFGPLTSGGQYGGQYGGLPTAAGSGLDFQGMDIPGDISSTYDPRTAGYPEAWLTGPEEAGYNVGNINQSLPRPGAQQSTIAPWERYQATDAFDLDPWAGGMDFIADEFVPPAKGRVGGTIRAEDMRAKQEAIARALQPTEPEPAPPLSQPNYYGAAGGFQKIVPEVAESWYEPYEDEETDSYYNPQPDPAPAPVYTPPPAPVIYPEDIPDVPVIDYYDAPEPIYYDHRTGGGGMRGMARGGRTNESLSLVGESGPELALFPNGTEIIPLDREMQPNQKKRLRRRGAFANAIDSFEFGGYVGGMGPRVADLPASAQTMPAGITEIMSGRPTRAPRSLMRQAGMRAPSAQTISNLLPEEISVYQEMGRMAGIPDKAFEREFRSMVPMGQGGTRQARFTPRSTGRTRYGSI